MSRDVNELLGVAAGLRTARPDYLFGTVWRDDSRAEGVLMNANYTLEAVAVLNALRDVLRSRTREGASHE